MKKPWLKSCLLSLLILFMSANILPYSFNSLASASYDPEETGKVNVDHDGSFELVSIPYNFDVSKFNYEEEEYNSDQNAYYDDADAPVSTFENAVNEANLPENQLPEQENNNSEPLNEDHNIDLAQQNNAEDVNDEHFTEDRQSEYFSDNQINEDNSVDENNLPIVVNSIHLDDGFDSSAAIRYLMEEYDDESPSEQEEKNNCCERGCLSILFKKFGL